MGEILFQEIENGKYILPAANMSREMKPNATVKIYIEVYQSKKGQVIRCDKFYSICKEKIG